MNLMMFECFETFSCMNKVDLQWMSITIRIGCWTKSTMYFVTSTCNIDGSNSKKLSSMKMEPYMKCSCKVKKKKNVCIEILQKVKYWFIVLIPSDYRYGCDHVSQVHQCRNRTFIAVILCIHIFRNKNSVLYCELF